MDQDERRSTTTAFVIAVVLLVLLSLLAAVAGGQVLPTLGITVVGASLFLPLGRTALVAALALALAAVVVLTADVDHAAVRLGNVALASALALLASWTIGQRMKRIKQLNTTQASVFASVADGLAVLTPDGTIRQLNDALLRLVPQARVGQRLHPALGHVLADGTACPGGCLLDVPRLDHPTLVESESIQGHQDRVAVEYTAAPVDDTNAVVSLRDVTAIKEAERVRRQIAAAEAREGEQRHLLEALGAPAFVSAPSVPGVEVDLFSIPTEPDAPTGGDLVNVSEMADGRIAVMIADALGDRVLSVRDAATVLHTARALVEAGVPLEEIVARTAQTLPSGGDGPDVSLMVAVLDPESGRLDLVGGGHPPALLVRENGASEWLESDGPGIGQDPAPTSLVATRQVTTDDSLVLYTDGVVDGTQDVIVGLQMLRASATALRKRPVAGWARSIVEAVMPPDQKSGSATVLLVRLDGTSGNRQTTATR